MSRPTEPADPPISASTEDLPADVAAALARPPAGRALSVPSGGLTWHALSWGDAAGSPVLLLHGVTSSAATWWRVGPALAAAGHHVVAIDQAGHGGTRRWLGHHRFRDNAADVTGFARAAGLPRAGLAVVGHSWGAMTAAALPAAGLRPAVLVLLDPPALPRSVMAAILEDPVERHYDDLDEAMAVVRLANPAWSDGDVRAKAEALTQFDERAVRDVLLRNEWDGGLADLAEDAARNVPVWVVRGVPHAGGYVPDEALPALVGRVGRERVVTIDGAPHSPQRTHPEATVLALLTALDQR